MTREELYAYAQRAKEPAGVQPLLTAIDEAAAHAASSGSFLAAASRDIPSAYRLNGRLLTPPHPDILNRQLLTYNAAFAKLETLFLTLACTLQQAGHKIEY